MITLSTIFLCVSFISVSQAFCGASIRWSHHVNIEHVFGKWYGVGYAQHTPDWTSKPMEIGCVTLHITDADEFNDDWLQWAHPRRDYSHHQQDWLSYRDNTYPNTNLSGSWQATDTRTRFRREVQPYKKRRIRDRRDMYGERRLKVIWDEDGQSIQQTYVYTKDVPGLWTVEKWTPVAGVDMWYPDNPPRHPEVIRVLKVSPQMLIINHCSDQSGGGIFTLILRRSPRRVGYWEWYEFQKEFYAFELPNVYRKVAVCAGCLPGFNGSILIICAVVLRLL